MTYQLPKGKMSVVIDAQAGSTGKGKLCGWLAQHAGCDISICDFQTNAGHTWVGDDGRHVMVQQTPIAGVNPNTVCLIAADAVICLDTLRREIDLIGFKPLSEKNDKDPGPWLGIHPRASVNHPSYAEQEGHENPSIASTMKGCGVARAEKIRRRTIDRTGIPRAILIGSNTMPPDISRFVMDTTAFLEQGLRKGARVMFEMAQGWDLCINFGLSYPYCTSRQINVGQALANSGVHPKYLGDTFAVIRPFPIRVGNVYDAKTQECLGVSGPYWHDNDELTWDNIKALSGAPKNIELGEYTTVTKRLRRVFTFSHERFGQFCMMNRPDHIFLNFAQYIDWGVVGVTDRNELLSHRAVASFMDSVEATAHAYMQRGGKSKPCMFAVGTGAKDGEIVLL